MSRGRRAERAQTAAASAGPSTEQAHPGRTQQNAPPPVRFLESAPDEQAARAWAQDYARLLRCRGLAGKYTVSVRRYDQPDDTLGLHRRHRWGVYLVNEREASS